MIKYGIQFSMHIEILFFQILLFFLPFHKDCENAGHSTNDPDRPTCTGITYQNGTFERWKSCNID